MSYSKNKWIRMTSIMSSSCHHCVMLNRNVQRRSVIRCGIFDSLIVVETLWLSWNFYCTDPVDFITIWNVCELRTRGIFQVVNIGMLYRASDFINKIQKKSVHGLFYSICYSLYISSVLIDAPELGCNDSWNIGRKIHIN